MKVAVFGQFFYPDSGKYVQQLLSVLKNESIQVYIEAQYYHLLLDKHILDEANNYNTFTVLDKSFDLFFSLGGDGTILSAVDFVKQLEIPIVGINTGRLGFLASIHKEEIQPAIDEILSQNYSITKRSLLEVQTNASNFPEKCFALNEMAISRRNTTAMITVETWLNKEYLNAYWSDGIILSTPTGSTGYSLSCGGPIITPESNSLVLTPIAPHNLNARPLVFPDQHSTRFKVSTREKDFLVSVDSKVFTVPANTEVWVSKADFSIHLVSLKSDSFLQTLRKKLLWGEDSRNFKSQN